MARDKYQLINETLKKPTNHMSISALCKLAGVSRSGYYKWLSTADERAKREEKDRLDFEKIQEAYAHRGYDKGIRGIHMRLLRMGIRMNMKKIRRLCRKYDLICNIRKANPYRRMAKALQTNSRAENILDRHFDGNEPRTTLCTDITYIPYFDKNHEKKFLYFTTVLDVATKEILAYKTSDSLEVSFVLELIKDLFKNHGSELVDGCILHTDQGVHYTSNQYIQLLETTNIQRSMSRRGNCWDNAPQESFFGHMKDEIAEKIKGCTDPNEIRKIIDDWVDYYNNDRCVWKLNKLPPSLYYQSLVGGLPLGEDGCLNEQSNN